MRVEVGKSGVEMIMVTGSEMVTYLVNKANLVHNFLGNFKRISFPYMFRATMCPSSGKTTVSLRHLVFVTQRG